jgi:hypothetical protein
VAWLHTVVGWALCWDHINDPRLQEALAEALVGGMLCDFCETRSRGVLVDGDAVRDVFLEAIEFYFDRAIDVLIRDEGEFIGPQTDTIAAVADVGSAAFEESVSDTVLQRIADEIGDVVWTDLASMGSTDGVEYNWSRFAELVKHRSRFFVAEADAGGRATLSNPFLNDVRAYAEKQMGLIRRVPPGSAFFRGRLAENPNSIARTASALGPAPTGRAAANRMSPAGISMFYASGDPETAVAEIAGHGIHRYAVIGKFTNIRPLRVLDLTKAPREISPFDRSRRNGSVMARFLESFVRHVTAPVIPDERQHVEYAPTQVLTEYFRWANKDLDGMAFPSAQTGRPTYVLFSDQREFHTVGEPFSSEFGPYGPTRKTPSFEMEPADTVVYDVIRTYTASPSDLYTRK